MNRGEYPHLQFKQHWTLAPEVHYELGQCDAIVEAIRDMPLRPEHYQRLLRVSLIKGAQATTAIEGNTLTVDEIEQISDGASLPPSRKYQEIEVRNVLRAMNELREEIAAEMKPELICSSLLLRFHELIGRDLGEHFDAVPGKFRTDQRVVGKYRCPDAREVPRLVDRLCEWLPAEFGYATGNQSFTDAVIQAIVTHVYIEWIHPFGDGNGRTGRLVEFYILLRAGLPDIASHILSNFYNQTRPEYYRQLDLAGKNRDLSGFIAYAVKGFRDGLQGTLAGIQRNQLAIAWRTFIYDKFADLRYRKRNVFKRRRELALHLSVEYPLSLEEIPGSSPELARAYAGLSPRTLLRDLEVLQKIGLIVQGDSKYLANIQSLSLRPARRLQR